MSKNTCGNFIKKGDIAMNRISRILKASSKGWYQNEAYFIIVIMVAIVVVVCYFFDFPVFGM